MRRRTVDSSLFVLAVHDNHCHLFDWFSLNDNSRAINYRTIYRSYQTYENQVEIDRFLFEFTPVLNIDNDDTSHEKMASCQRTKIEICRSTNDTKWNSSCRRRRVTSFNVVQVMFNIDSDCVVTSMTTTMISQQLISLNKIFNRP
jgi:hypothetical protein